MEVALIVLRQIFSMTAVLMTGFVCAKKGILDSDVARKLSSLILVITSPAVIILAFNRPFDRVLTVNLAVAALAALIAHLVAIAVASFFFRDTTNPAENAAIVSVVFSNSGFFSFPILQEMFGKDGIFIGSAYFIVFNLLSWTYMVYVFTRDKKQVSPKKALVNPSTIAVAIGLLLYLSPVKPPEVLLAPVDAIAVTNTPLAMLVTGVFISQIDLGGAFRSARVWIACALRLIVVPLIVFVLLHILPIDRMVAQTILVAVSAPAAIGVSLFAARLEKDVATSTSIVAVTSLLCVITLPATMLLSRTLWG